MIDKIDTSPSQTSIGTGKVRSEILREQVSDE